MGISTLYFQRPKKKGDAARFLDARGDEKQDINVERTYLKFASFSIFSTVSEYNYVVTQKKNQKNYLMSATHYRKLHVDIFICIEMARERNRVIKKEHPVYD